jgi:Holliday junction DNA helicase RuvA
MIDFLRGKAVHIETEYVVIDVHGVGYRVFCANPYTFQIQGDAPEVTLYIHHHVREDAILLYGFASRAEQSLFRKLLDVSGIGPRVAIGVLSAGSPQDVIAAVQREDVALLTKLPGIGKKTAQRMILELKDKLSAIVPTQAGAAVSGTSAQLAGGGISRTMWNEAKEALAALGYTEAELDRAWPSIKEQVKETDSIDTLVKKALQALYKG